MPFPRVDRGGAVLMLLTAVALMTAPRTASAQFSPGPLSSSHAAIDSPTACLQCHEPKRATTAARCLACHRPLAARIRAGTGYHGGDKARSTQCATCHAEHGGRDAALVAWPGGREAFDHGLTGYALEGGHAKVECRSCHMPARVRAADVRAATDLTLAKTYLGLSTRCLDCHKDVHRGQFAARVAQGDCASCHNALAWKPVSVDHASTRYPLTGLHAQVRCESCHRTENAGNAPEDTFVRYRPVAHDACVDCHTDPHKNRYGPDCTKCHSTAGWTSIATGSFDHSKTRYPLLGRHKTVGCVECHGSGDFKKKLVFARCADCHSDVHGGQLAQSASRGACEACHTVDGFAPARYGVEEHAKTRFPLRGAHLAVACVSCHGPTAKNAQRGSVRFRVEGKACADCHEDEHSGQFSGSAGGSGCARCHGERSWHALSFDHKATRFPLDGAHARAACAACHKPASIGGRRTVRYRPLDTACRSCHATMPAGDGRSS